MTGDVPSPWDLTDPYAREAAVLALPDGPAEQAQAVAALTALAARLASRPPADPGAIPAELAEGWSFTALRIAAAVPRLDDYRPGAVVTWLREHGLREQADRAGDAIGATWIAMAEARAAYDAAGWLREREPAALAAVADRYGAALPAWVAERLRPLETTRMRVTLSGPLLADPVRSWLDRLPLDLGPRGRHEAADELAAGRAVTGRLTPPGSPAVAVTLTPQAGGLVMELGGPAGADEWWSTLVTAAGRMLRATTVELPGLLWVSPAAAGDFATARAEAGRADRQWDGALLLHR